MRDFYFPKGGLSMKPLNIPVGISDFSEIRKNGYYYVDKSFLIRELLKIPGTQVTLITRPRRFGKTLGMSMLASFFDIRKDSKESFQDLEISTCTDLCRTWQNQYPTIFISFRRVDGLTFSEASYMLATVISELYQEHSYLLDSPSFNAYDKNTFSKIASGITNPLELKDSLFFLTRMMQKRYGKPVILLIDEYDVPLDKAFQNGFYREMVSLIRGLFGMALKTNDSLQFAVLTGCMRISKESIFTGLNNFEVLSILNDQYDESFGFTDAEVKKILNDYNFKDHYLEVKEWYDGYHFGNTDIYCPWDVIQYCKSLYLDVSAKPQDFWSNSSGNAIVRRFIDKADISTRNEIERLIAGESIEKDVVSELTYDEIDKSIENLWSVLFTTGYLTHKGCTESGKYHLVIPNREIRNLFVKKIREWFSDVSRKDGKTLEEFCSVFIKKDSKKIEQIFGDYLWNTISIRDTAVAKENFIKYGIACYKKFSKVVIGE